MQYSQQSDNQNSNDLKKYTPIFVIVGIIFLLVMFWGRITKTIPAGHGGVLFRLFGGGVDTSKTYEEGFRCCSAYLCSSSGKCYFTVVKIDYFIWRSQRS